MRNVPQIHKLSKISCEQFIRKANRTLDHEEVTYEISARIINAAAPKTLKKHNQNEQQKHGDFASHAGFSFKFILLKTRENN